MRGAPGDVLHVPDVVLPEEVRDGLRDLIAAEREARAAAEGTVAFRACGDPGAIVSEAALHRVLHEGVDVSDVRTDEALSNCLVFHTTGLAGSVVDPKVERRRTALDAMLADLFARHLGVEEPCPVVASGHFWYPPGSFMGWHTNSRVVGMRAYLTYAAEPGRSFFRYRDRATGEIVTSTDTGWDLRFFAVTAEEPLWHAVCSYTDRFSFGYRLLAR